MKQTDDTNEQLLNMKVQLLPLDSMYEQLISTFSDDGKLTVHKRRLTRLATMEDEWKPYQKKIDKYIAKVTADSGDLPSKIAKAASAVKENCPHPRDQLIFGFDQNGTDVTYWVECSQCGAVSPKQTKSVRWSS